MESQIPLRQSLPAENFQKAEAFYQINSLARGATRSRSPRHHDQFTPTKLRLDTELQSG